MEGSLLFIDDDSDILNANHTYFTAAGFETDTAATPEEALALLKDRRYDCIILDIRMDGTDGYMLCRHIRSTIGTPIIFLTSLTDEDALIKGFSCGADDYVVKPYSLKALEARIRVRMIPRPKAGHSVLKFGSLSLNPLEKRAVIDGIPAGLTVNEFEILYFLALHKGVPFTPEALYSHIWNEKGIYQSHSIQTMILRIRKKLCDIAPNSEYIRTQWGKGYFFADS